MKKALVPGNLNNAQLLDPVERAKSEARNHWLQNTIEPEQQPPLSTTLSSVSRYQEFGAKRTRNYDQAQTHQVQSDSLEPEIREASPLHASRMMTRYIYAQSRMQD